MVVVGRDRLSEQLSKLEVEPAMYCSAHILEAASLQDPKASSGSILYWSWSKPQVGVKCFPEKPVKPLVANSEGTYLVGGGLSRNIYFEEVGSLSNRISLRNIQFPSIIDAITLDPDEHVFYAGGRDGKIHIAALNADSSSSKSHWLHIISSLPSHSNKAQLLQAEMEVEKLKLDCTQSMQMLQRWKKMYDNLHEFCEDELLNGDDVGSANQILT
ncbi:hypothetical protein H0E87_004694 [Populus deltoides]|uniref:Uncharacterized protein n=1 Tax=Populus deltoides TaxID=3696 RepID=A0A8T2ZGJ3_POPDE|nr:hypothetical protein H0E87_004694 [Populus deltoides]